MIKLEFNRIHVNLNKLTELIDLNNEVNCLDIFAKEGDWQSFNFINKFDNYEAWDIDQNSLKILKNKFPTAVTNRRDSISYINQNKKSITNLLIIDNSLNCYGENREYCEHFDFIENVGNILYDESYIILNVCLKPFGLDNFPDWKLRREKFYKVEDTSNLNIDYLKSFYVNLFEKNNLKVIKTYSLVKEYFNEVDYLYYFMFKILKK